MAIFTPFLVLALCLTQAHGALKLASYYSDHMVLQRGPQRAVLWGTADTEGDTVTAQVTGQGSAVTTTVHNGSWKLKLPAITVPGPFVIDVRSGDGHVRLHDVLFGDVWFCSGQSNMQFSMNQILNSSSEIHKGLASTNIRFTNVAHINSSTPQSQAEFYIPWTRPTMQYLPQVSAVCFLFAEYLQTHLNYPIGLVQASWVGTTIEAWSPPEAVHSCPLPHYRHYLDCCPMYPQVLFNGMVHPLLDMTIYGVLWYQGEANEGHDHIYKCQMKALVDQWRVHFNKQSLGETPLNFPFGYVQLASGQPGFIGSRPALRWAQTAGYGYSPNPDLPNTFMAVAMDLKDDSSSPLGTSYPRDKQDVAERLMLGALHVAYGRHDVTFQGPFPTSFEKDSDQRMLRIEYDHGHTPLDIRSRHGFDVCCNTFPTCDENGVWVDAPITDYDTSDVTVSYAGCGTRRLAGLRYAWRSQPCGFKQCAIYSADSDLPAPVFITKSPPA